MKQPHKYLTEETAIETIKRFFPENSGDVISIEEALQAWGRDLTQEKQNKQWLSNKLVDLKYHHLVNSLYAMRNNRRTLNKLQLTLKGKRALGRIVENDERSNTQEATMNSQAQQSNETVSFTDVMQMISKLRKDNPDYEITFDIKLKGGIV